MKKFIVLFLVGILVFGGVGAFAGLKEQSEIKITEAFSFSQPKIIEERNHVTIELDEASINSIKEDKPMLPIITKTYTFPFGTNVKEVDVTFSETKEIIIEKPVIISPEITAFSTEYRLKNQYQTKEIYDYSNIEIYPESRFGYRAGAGLDGEERVTYLTVTLKPVQYRPQDNIILYSESAEIGITYELPENPMSFPDVYDLLIITPSQFESALQRLVDHKNNLNPPVRTIMVTLDDIPSGLGVDTQEDIKYYIKDAIETWGITYLIIVGAGETGKEIFPVRKAYISSPPLEDYFPSDLYYADIYNATGAFSDWDHDDDGKFAEYPMDKSEMDIHPDVYLGKIPCSTVKELDVVIDKIIYYKQHNKMVNRILQCGADSLPGSGVYEGEYANEKVMEKLPGYNSIRLWGTNGKLTKEEIGAGFRSNVDFVDMSGHGSHLSWASHLPDGDDDVWIPAETLISPWSGFLHIDVDLYMLTNSKKFPVLVFTACSNNNFMKAANNIGWKMLSKNGGGTIATFAESGIGHGPGGPEFVTVGIGYMEVKAFEYLATTKILGQVWGNCISSYYNTHESSLDKEDYKTMTEFSMFGDPTVAIQNGDDPGPKDFDQPISNGLLNRIFEKLPVITKIISLIVTKINH